MSPDTYTTRACQHQHSNDRSRRATRKSFRAPSFSHFPLFFAERVSAEMAVVQITEAEAAQGMAALNSELRYMLEEKSVDKELMSLLGVFGIVDSETFSGGASDETSLRAMMNI